MRSVRGRMSPLRILYWIVHHSIRPTYVVGNGRAPQGVREGCELIGLRGWLRRTCLGTRHCRGKTGYSPFLSRGLATLVSRVSFCVESREAIFNMGLDHSKWRLKPQLIWGYMHTEY